MPTVCLSLLLSVATSAGAVCVPDPQEQGAAGDATACWSPPGQNFDLSGWKLMIPGPKEVDPAELAHFAGPNFHSDAQTGAMVFWLDSASSGSSPNSNYVRSELRELYQGREDSNWDIRGRHVMSADLALPHTAQTPDKVTVLQIHGVGDDVSEKAPPLLRVALVKGDLTAYFKTDNAGDTTEKVVVVPGIGSRAFKADVDVTDGQLVIRVDGEERFRRDVSFWTWRNYFKAGDYAQATAGISEVHFYNLEVHHGG